MITVILAVGALVYIVLLLQKVSRLSLEATVYRGRALVAEEMAAHYSEQLEHWLSELSATGLIARADGNVTTQEETKEVLH